MRLYGGRKIHGAARRQIAAGQELRDAIVWSVDTTNHYAMVKIQGSDTLIKAYFPENWESTPQYLKPGNAVRITHPGGNRGRIEIASHGFLIPTAIPGGTGTPPDSTAADTLLTGMIIFATGELASWQAVVSIGTYRIDGVTYTFGEISMDNDIEMDVPIMEMDGTNGVGGSVTFDPASGIYYRYDIVVIGADGVLDVVKGNNASSYPTMPSVPADHILVGWVLFYPSQDEIRQEDVYAYYSIPEIVALGTSVTQDSLHIVNDCSELLVDPLDCPIYAARTSHDIIGETGMELTCLDQYGNPVQGSWSVLVEWIRGNGSLIVDGGTYDAADGSFEISFYGHGKALQYWREGNPTGDISPTLRFTVQGVVRTIIGFVVIYLYSDHEHYYPTDPHFYQR